MADEGNPEDVLPIKKTSNAIYIGGGVGAVVILGLIIALSGGDEGKKEEAAETVKAADAAQGMTKAEAEERMAHIKKTQAALVAAEQEENAEAATQKAAADAKQAEAASQTEEEAPKPSGTSQKSPSPAPKPAVNKKKTMNSLDGLGSDIADALK